jgi:hypothetical protein
MENNFIYQKIILDHVKNKNLLCVKNIINYLKKNLIIFDLHILNDLYFKIACSNNDIEMAKYLWNISEQNDDPIILQESIHNVQFIDEWMWEYIDDPSSLFYLDTEQLFALICLNGNLDMAKWLYDNIKDIYNISNHNHDLFKICCYNNVINIVEWLSTINHHYKYKIQNNKIISYKIQDIYQDLLDYYNDNDTENIKKIFFEETYITNGVCTICKFENENYLLTLKCNINENIYDHCYCIPCFCKWYKNNAKQCLLCWQKFDFSKIVVFIKKN